MSKPFRLLITEALFEAFFVVLGVILAFGANEWRQNKIAHQQAESALYAIHEELINNQQLVQASLDYHNALMQMIYSQNSTPTIRDFSRGFISPANVFQTAWHSATNTGVLAELPYEQVLSLSRMYSVQAKYGDQGALAGEVIYTALYEQGPMGMVENYKNLGSIIASFVYRETELVEEYEQILSKLKK